jgi:hypothetical protein
MRLCLNTTEEVCRKTYARKTQVQNAVCTTLWMYQRKYTAPLILKKKEDIPQVTYAGTKYKAGFLTYLASSFSLTLSMILIAYFFEPFRTFAPGSNI